jgi:hypothetical protein
MVKNALAIGSNISSDLVTSSLRLDSKNLESELGLSTHHSRPTVIIKLFLSSSSIKKANALLVKKAIQINSFDKYSQLRQLRSNLSRFTTI